MSWDGARGGRSGVYCPGSPWQSVPAFFATTWQLFGHSCTAITAEGKRWGTWARFSGLYECPPNQ